jgi:TM2 domain-containing membrane protein YozV
MEIKAMQKANSGTGYLFWCLCFLGICGGQRFYTGSIGSGLLYLFTFGVFGIGQVIDLFLIPDMVSRRNVYLRGLHSSNTPNVNQSVTLNIGDIPQLQPPQVLSPSVPSTINPMQKLLKAAKEHGGQLSIAQAAMYTDLEPEEVKKLLEDAQRAGYAEISNDSKTGAIRYQFDI